MSEKEDLNIVKAIWLAKWKILLFSLVATVTVYSATIFIPEEFISRSTYVISHSKFSTGEKIDFLTADDYKRLILTLQMLQAVIDRVKIKHPDYQEMYPETLGSMIDVNYMTQERESAKSSRGVLVILSVRGTDQSFIADVANTLPDLLIEKSRSIRESENEAISRDAKIRYDENFRALTEVEEQLRRTMTANHLESAEDEIQVMRTSLKQHEVLLIRTKLDLVDIRSQMNSSSKLIKNTRKSYMIKHDLLETNIKKLKDSIKFLEDSVFKMRLQEKQLRRSVKLLSNNNDALAARLEKIVISESEKTSDVKIVSRATEPEVPVYPDRFAVTWMGAVLSLLLGIVITYSREHINRLI